MPNREIFKKWLSKRLLPLEITEQISSEDNSSSFWAVAWHRAFWTKPGLTDDFHRQNPDVEDSGRTHSSERGCVSYCRNFDD